MEFSELLLGPHYTPGVGRAVLVTLSIGSADYADLPARDTTGAALADDPATVEIQRLQPSMRFRLADLIAAEIDLADLTGAEIEMNGRRWRVESHVPLGAPDGEDAGEIGCIISEVETT